ncbi:MAG TPA: amidohydrolase family protein [Vicinamibacterales bacterium]|jgi:imidazolonepropionase-like amidohydrolase|nr:amidohydrolase family protein [Vicinamibacterales bacterium]
MNRAVLAAGLVVAASCGERDARSFVSTRAPVIAITHVRVIDGTGTAARDDQTVILEAGRIGRLGNAAVLRPPEGAQVVDGHGRALMPGLVGMHDHLFYMQANASVPVQAAFARLYLANGVTTIRTAGTVDLEGDLRVKRDIDAGRLPGPKIHVSGQYLSAPPGPPNPALVAQEVAAEADRGATSFKAYMTLRASELRAAIQAAHARGLSIAGHLCAVGFRDAAAMGIDSLEHGLIVDTEFYSNKQVDQCPEQGASIGELAELDVGTDPRIHRMIGDLVGHGVAVTSTLAVFETLTGYASAVDPRTPAVLAPTVRLQYNIDRSLWADPNTPGARAWASALAKEMQFERMFVAAGGRLMAGVDPTGWGGIVAGFGDQRELELLVEAGFTPAAAIKIATENGAAFLHEGDRVGRIAEGYQADLVLMRGDPSVKISDVRNVELVFKDGIGYDTAALIATTEGTVGRYDLRQVSRRPFGALLIGAVALVVLYNVVRYFDRRKAKRRRASSTRPDARTM